MESASPKPTGYGVGVGADDGKSGQLKAAAAAGDSSVGGTTPAAGAPGRIMMFFQRGVGADGKPQTVAISAAAGDTIAAVYQTIQTLDPTPSIPKKMKVRQGTQVFSLDPSNAQVSQMTVRQIGLISGLSMLLVPKDQPSDRAASPAVAMCDETTVSSASSSTAVKVGEASAATRQTPAPSIPASAQAP